MFAALVFLLTLTPVCSGPASLTRMSVDEPHPDLQVVSQGTADGSTYKLSYADYNATWSWFKNTYGKKYRSPEEEAHRFNVFMETINLIEYHNWRFHNKKSSYWMALNHFSDLTTEEFRSLHGFPGGRAANRTSRCTEFHPSTKPVADRRDWRRYGVVTPVKNQGQCGSCWTFSTTGSVEGQWARVKGQLVSLSEQQIMDCSRGYGTQSCNGGYMDSAMEYIIDNGGLEKEKDYPYEARDNRCRSDKSRVAVTISACKDVVPRQSEDALKFAVGNIGPVSIAIDATHPSFQSYAGGVYDEPRCRTDLIDHAVLVVGYDTDPRGQDYWLVKNSWGTRWGDQGYIKMSRNKGNQCGVASLASFPVV